jgi:CMP-N-acetylneuraminic acid synthetase
MNKDILLLGYAREGSTRVKEKMIRSFGNTTLFDIYINKLMSINNFDKNLFSNITMAIGKSDKTLWDKTKQWDIPISERTDYSINASITDDCNKVYHYLNDFDEEYVMWINGCFPFLRTESIIKAVEYFKKNNLNGLHCVKKVYNWVWNPETGLLINIENAKKMSTVHFKPYYESVHCFHIYRRKYLLENNCYWTFIKNDPYLYEVSDNNEFMDIDTMDEFDRCENIYRMNYFTTIVP